MSKLRCQISISRDGFVAGPNQSKEEPLGEGDNSLRLVLAPEQARAASHHHQHEALAA